MAAHRIARAQPLPFGVGRITPGWSMIVAILLAGVLVGAFAYALQYTEGEVVTGMRDIGTMGGAPWGLYIAFVVYFVGVSFAGIAVAAIVRVLDLERLRPVARMGELLAVISLVLGALSILADVGQPLRAIVNLLRYARPQSPFFGTFTLVISGYLFASLVYLFLEGRRDAAILARTPGRLQWLHRLWASGYRDTPAERERHERASYWLALAILPLLVTAHSTLGFVFGLQAGRGGWFSTLQAPGFVVLAGVSGLGNLIVLAAILRWALRAKQVLDDTVFRWLANFLLALTIVYLYFLLVDWLTSTYAAPAADARLAAVVYTGEYAPVFWTSVAALVAAAALLFGQFARRRYSLALVVVAAVLVNVAAVGKRVVLVLPSQTHGALLPYVPGTYEPTLVEYGVLLGIFSLGALLLTLFMKVFPILEVGGHHAEVGS
ncbi:MAG: polysulfide reductase NrfD [Chloroflexi bacterium]|nr:polysulfide reductase NrfD [Chloroflexota bacterium]